MEYLSQKVNLRLLGLASLLTAGVIVCSAENYSGHSFSDYKSAPVVETSTSVGYFPQLVKDTKQLMRYR